MTWLVWSAFATSVLVLALAPGPSNLLVTSVAVSRGFAAAAWTILGDVCANLVQMALAALGLGALLHNVDGALEVLQIAGVVYLVVLAVRLLQATDAETPVGALEERPVPRERAFLRGFAIAGRNPKAVLFFIGFFPLFLRDGPPLFGQLLWLGSTYVLIDAAVMGCYALLGRGLSASVRSLAPRASRWIGATLFLVTALALCVRLVS